MILQKGVVLLPLLCPRPPGAVHVALSSTALFHCESMHSFSVGLDPSLIGHPLQVQGLVLSMRAWKGHR